MLYRKSRLSPENEIFKIKCLLCYSKALNGGVSRQREQKEKIIECYQNHPNISLAKPHEKEKAGKAF